MAHSHKGGKRKLCEMSYELQSDKEYDIHNSGSMEKQRECLLFDEHIYTTPPPASAMHTSTNMYKIQYPKTVPSSLSACMYQQSLDPCLVNYDKSVTNHMQ